MTTNLKVIAIAAETNAAENLRLKELLLSSGPAFVDELVFKLNETIAPQIDCTTCGNCCRSLMINVEPNDATR